MIRKLITMVAVMGITASSQAGITTDFTVDDAAHLLDGAVFSTFVEGADTWSEGAPGSFGAAGSNATLTISGALGAGADWNGVYSYYNGTGIGLFVGASQEGGASYGTAGLTVDQEAAVPYWQDGTGNQLYFLVAMNAGTTIASDGATVVQDNFGGFNGLLLRSVGGSNPSFLDPTGGVGSVNVIPEPGTISLMSLSTLGLFFTRTIRRRKRFGQTLVPIRRVPLCDAFISEDVWINADCVEEGDVQTEGMGQLLLGKLTRYFQYFAAQYQKLDKAFWDRMVKRHERRVERRQVRLLSLKKKTLHGLDEFLALIMK